MNNDKILRFLKIALVLAMLLFVVVYSKYKTNDCQLCTFDVDGERIRLNEFLEIYSNECFDNSGEIILNQTGGIK